MLACRRVVTIGLAIIVAVAYAPVVLGAPASVEWVQHLGTPDGERYPDVSVDNLGHVYVAGTTDGSLAGPKNYVGSNSLAQYNTSGALNWVRQFGVSSNVTHGVASDHRGNAYVTGETTSPVGREYSPSQDVFVTKYDAS